MSNQIHSFAVATTLAAARIVYLSAANTVAYLNTITSVPVGVTVNTVLDATQKIPVQCDGIVDLYFNDSVAAGALVAGNANGQGIPYVAVSASMSYPIGILIDAKVNTTGTVAKVLLRPLSGISAA
jgi:hypothetical protein